MNDNPDQTEMAEIRSMLEKVLTAVSAPNHAVSPSVSSLSPRRQEIVATIREQGQVSFDFLMRNFRGVTPSLLHYDLQQLIRKGIIRKLGVTRGAVYSCAG